MNHKLDAATVTILVVEDDPNNLLVITRLLKLAGIQDNRMFTSTADPSEFLASRPVSPDLIFLDIQLPKKDGYAILGELRADPKTKDTCIIALTANVMKQDIEKAKKAGFDGFIGKPIDGRRFAEILKKLLDGESVWMVQ